MNDLDPDWTRPGREIFAWVYVIVLALVRAYLTLVVFVYGGIWAALIFAVMLSVLKSAWDERGRAEK